MSASLFRNSVTDHVIGTSFNVYSAEEIRKLSVKQLKVASAFDQLGHPVVGCVRGAQGAGMCPRDAAGPCP